jgi:hypothetical protein
LVGQVDVSLGRLLGLFDEAMQQNHVAFGDTKDDAANRAAACCE